jgi:5-methylcytosine-specific restriction endonuclease McrA
MRVIDQRTSEPFLLHATRELTAALENMASEFDCSHARREVRRHVNAARLSHYYEQCLRCGQRVGSAIARANVSADAPDEDGRLAKEFAEARDAARSRVIQHHVDIQRARTSSRQKEYDEYIRSPAWRVLRTKVMHRAAGRCEGCADAPATEVHHLTYDHFKAEFLFELVALCSACHDRVHGVEPEEFEEEPPCCDCQWSDMGRCGQFEMPIALALAADGPCGPERIGLEGYK